MPIQDVKNESEIFQLIAAIGQRTYIRYEGSSAFIEINNSQKLLVNQLQALLTRESINLPAKDGVTTPLIYAMEKCSLWSPEGLDTFQLLIKRGADLEDLDKKGKSLLHFALDSKHLGMIKFLIAKGVNLEIQDNAGKTPLHKAVELSLFEIIELLISKGVKLEAVDAQGRTALHHAVIKNRYNVLELLIAKKVKIEAMDLAGMRPLHYACLHLKRGQVEHPNVGMGTLTELVNETAAELLIMKGADIFAEVTAGDHKNKSAFEMLLQYKSTQPNSFFGVTSETETSYLRTLFLKCFQNKKGTDFSKKPLNPASQWVISEKLANYWDLILHFLDYRKDWHARDYNGVRSILGRAIIDSGFPLNLNYCERSLAFYDRKLKYEAMVQAGFQAAYTMFALAGGASISMPGSANGQATSPPSPSPGFISEETRLLPLFREGASLNQRDINGNTPLHIACKQLNVQWIINILKICAPKKEPSTQLLQLQHGMHGYDHFRNPVPERVEVSILELLTHINFEKPAKTPLDEITCVIADLAAKIKKEENEKEKSEKERSTDQIRKIKRVKSSLNDDYQKAITIRSLLMDVIQPYIDKFIFKLLQYKIPNLDKLGFNLIWSVAKDFSNTFPGIHSELRFSVNEQGRFCLSQAFEKSLKSSVIISAVIRVLEETLQARGQFLLHAQMMNLKAYLNPAAPESEFLSRSHYLQEEFRSLSSAKEKYLLCTATSKSEPLYPHVLMAWAKSNNIKLKLREDLYVVKDKEIVLKSKLLSDAILDISRENAKAKHPAPSLSLVLQYSRQRSMSLDSSSSDEPYPIIIQKDKTKSKQERKS